MRGVTLFGDYIWRCEDQRQRTFFHPAAVVRTNCEADFDTSCAMRMGEPTRKTRRKFARAPSSIASLEVQVFLSYKLRVLEHGITIFHLEKKVN